MATRKKTTRKRTAKAPESPAKPPEPEATRDTEPPAAVDPEPTSRDDEPTTRTTTPKPAPKPEPAAAPRATLLEGTRARVVEAVYLEALDQGCDKRDAMRIAEDSADRLGLAHECPPGLVPEAGFYDLRSEQDYKYPGGKRKVRMRPRTSVPVRRNPADVTTIVVHQTAVEFGVSKRAIANAGGDVELARARRALDVACHAMAFRQGYFVAAHDLDVYVNHGNRYNATSLGLEIDGRYPGLRDDPSTTAREDLLSTWGGKPTTLTPETVAAACAALAWLVEQGRAAGMPISKIVSHRQSSDMRRSDPGAEIWQRVVLASADELGLEVDRSSPWREGRPVPVEWDPNGIGPY